MQSQVAQWVGEYTYRGTLKQTLLTYMSNAKQDEKNYFVFELLMNVTEKFEP